jgi:hypothetical protein
MLHREGKEGAERLRIARERGDGLRILRLVLGDELGDRRLRLRPGWGVHDLVQGALRLRLQPLGELAAHVRQAVPPTPLLLRLGPPLAHRRPEAVRAGAHGHDRGGHAARLQVPAHPGPALRALAAPVLDRDQFLRAVRAHAAPHPRAPPIVLEPNPEVHPIDPDVHVVAGRETPLAPRGVLRLPVRRAARDRRRRQPGGRMRLRNRCRSPASSTRRSFTRGVRSAIVPAPTVTWRSRPCPFRATWA